MFQKKKESLRSTRIFLEESLFSQIFKRDKNMNFTIKRNAKRETIKYLTTNLSPNIGTKYDFPTGYGRGRDKG